MEGLREIYNQYADRVYLGVGTTEDHDTNHSSMTDRYAVLASTILNPQNEQENIIKNLILDPSVQINIRDLASGLGLAITGLMHTLENKYTNATVEICGKYHPSEIMQGIAIGAVNFFSTESNYVKLIGLRSRDIYANNKNELRAGLAVYGYVERYLQPAYYYRDIINSLKNNNVVALVPGNCLVLPENQSTRFIWLSGNTVNTYETDYPKNTILEEGLMEYHTYIK